MSTATLLAAHAELAFRVRTDQQKRLDTLRELEYDVGFDLIPDRAQSSVPVETVPTLSSNPRELSPRLDHLPVAKRARAARYKNYVPEEETIRNDYSQHYVDSGIWPQNWLLGADLESRFEEYPKQQRLLALKRAAVEDAAHPPMLLPLSSLRELQSVKFDVILIDPPLSDTFTWNDLSELQIPTLAADPSFVFLWVGTGATDGLERGREILSKWGYRRAEDVVWVKTNNYSNRGPGCDRPTDSLLTITKEHCLMGIRGTVRRSTDSWFVHCNIDTDVIIWEGDLEDPTRKPPEMYSLIENFCLGTRRLELFGRSTSLRRGWVTVVDSDIRDTTLQDEGLLLWDKERWETGVKRANAKPLVPNTPEIELLRPKSPVRAGSNHPQNSSPGNLPQHLNVPNPGIAGFPMQPAVHNMMPMPIQMAMPMAINPAMGMMPMPMNMNMPMANMGFGGMPTWMGMPTGDPGFIQTPIMGQDIWMGDPSMVWRNNDGNWNGG